MRESHEARRGILFDAEDLRRFARESHDVNPLHMDDDHARRSAFGQRVVFGALGGLACLDRLPDRPGWRLDRIALEFRNPLFLGIDYELHDERPSEQEAVVELRDGDLTVVRLAAGFSPSDGEADEAAGAGPAPGSGPFPATFKPLRTPADHDQDALAAGIVLEGHYRAKPSAGPFPACRLMLRLASYLVGMRLPGRRALFSKLTLRFTGDAPAVPIGTVRYRLATRSYDPVFGALSLDLAVWSEAGLLAEGGISAFVRKDIAVPTAEPEAIGCRTDERFRGKVALVIGGSRGLGAAIVRALARRGCQVAVNYRSSGREAEALASSLAGAPGSVLLLPGDAGDAGWCAEAGRRLRERFGRLDILVCNACTPPVTLGSSPSSKRAADRYVATNHALVSAPLEAFLPEVAANDGTVVAVSSIILEHEGGEWPHYRRLKTAVEALIQSAAARYPGVSFLLPRPPALLTDMSNTPLRAAQALRPEIVADAVAAALVAPEAGRARVLNTFREPAPAAAEAAVEPAPVAAPVADDAIVVAATFTHEPLLPALEHWRRVLGLAVDVRLAPYNQLFRDLLDPQGSLAANPRGLNVILVRIEDWLRNASGDDGHGPDRTRPPSARDHDVLRGTLTAFLDALGAYGRRSRCVTALLLCPASSPEGEDPAWRTLLAETGAELRRHAPEAMADLICLHAEDFHHAYRVAGDIHEPVRDALAHIPYTTGYFNVLGTLIARCHFHIRKGGIKVLAIDCDNTLWRGVCGEAGAGGVGVDGPFRRFHERLAEQAGRGVVLCLCSKNVEEDVWAVFDARPDMPLRREHIIDSRINWQPKSENLRSLASALNLGLDSFVFIDDNPVECAEVRAACPEVTTIQWPGDPAEIGRHLDHLWVFDRFLATEADRQRSASYRSQVERGRLRERSADFAAFLRDLNLVIDIRPLDDADMARAGQLTQRTNQFNLSTLRKTAGEVRQWIGRPGHEGWTVRVGDRFGDYGLVGLLLLRQADAALEVETFLLSCRVLGRGVEHRMLAHVGELACRRSLATMTVRFVPTAKNRPARMFLDAVVADAAAQGDGAFDLTCDPERVRRIDFVPDDAAALPAAGDDAEPASRHSDPTPARERERQLSAALEACDMAGLAAAIGHSPGPAARDWQTSAAEAPDAAGLAGMLDELRSLFATVLDLPPEALDPDAPLESYGIDSMRIVELTVALKRSWPDLPVTFLFEHKTLAGAAAALPRRGPPDEPAGTRPVGAARPSIGAAANGTADDAIAIIGMNGRFPGAPDPGTFWDNLKAGRCLIGDIPPDRWEVEAFFDPAGGEGRGYTRVGGFLADIDRFDAAFFHISPREAELMDPQQRLMLECAWGLLEDAGYTRATIDRDTGVFIGALSMDYAAYANNEALASGGAYRNADFYQIPNRISYFYDLHGPSLLIDTACSASATALHFACQSLRAGTCGMAIAGGINLFLHPSRFVQYSQMRMISPTSRCSPFGAEANGTLFGEGVGALLLKPLARARADGDNIHGVIRSCTVNSGGKSNGFTVPDPEAQADLIARAIRAAGIGSETIGYVEAHGTGTPLGDPIEVRGLTMAFARTAGARTAGARTAGARTAGDGAARPACALGTVKANIGHLESAAPMAGIIKTLLQLKHATLVPSLHAKVPNPAIPFAETPFRVQQDLSEWSPIIRMDGGTPVALPRRAGVSSFGAGGSNAHTIIEEYPADPRPAAGGVHLFPFSAQREATLRDLARQFVDFLRGEDGRHLAPADIAFTLQTGRETMTERLAVVAGSRDELIDALDRWLSSGMADGPVARGVVAPKRGGAAAAFEITEIPASRTTLIEAARAWVAGGRIDWTSLHARKPETDARRQPRRVSLPTYPFGGDRHWLPGRPNLALSRTIGRGNPPVADRAGPAALLPASTRRVFSAADPVIRDHRVQGGAILPGVAYLQAALAAAGVVSGDRCRMERVVWSHPFDLDSGEKALEIRLEPGADGLRFALRTEGAGETAPHAQGTLHRPADTGGALPAAPAAFDAGPVRARCPNHLDKPAIYGRFAAMGIEYGPHFQGVESVVHDGREALGVLALPAGREAEAAAVPFHPTLMDGALQTALLLASSAGTTLLPFALDRVEVFRPLAPRCLAHVTRNAGHGYDVVVTDESGAVCVTMGNLVLRERADPLRDLFHLPAWEARGAAGGAPPAPAAGCCVMIGGGDFPDLRQGIAAAHGGGGIVELAGGPAFADPAALEKALAACGTIGRICFLGGLHRPPADMTDPAALAGAEEAGVLAFFRLVKALHRLDRARDAMAVTIVTNDLHTLDPAAPTIPYAASLVGLAKVVAKEFPRLHIACVDLDGGTLERCRDREDRAQEDWARVARLVLAEPENHGEETLIREGVRHVRSLHPLRLPASPAIDPPDGFTCLILGGAGGIGFEYSRHLARTRRAKLVWIGRREEDLAIRDKIGRIRALGGDVLYCRADATDADAMAAAVAAARRHFGPIRGAVHSAIVLEDRTIANMDEGVFCRALHPKTRGSVALARALKDEPLDFLLFFSSINSFQASMGQANYVAGCHFKDAFGRWLHAASAGTSSVCRVRIVNWGYWGSVGIVASEDYRARLAAEGHGSIEPDEGMAAIGRIVAQPLPQIVAMKADAARRKDIGVVPGRRAVLPGPGIPPVLGRMPLDTMAPALDGGTLSRFRSAFDALESLGRRMLLGTLAEMGVLERPGERWTVAALRDRLGVVPAYHDLFAALIDLLADCGALRLDGEAVEATARVADPAFRADRTRLEGECRELGDAWPELRDRLPLLLACHRSWAAVLTGRVNHMEVLFPKGDLGLVEGIYRGNAVTEAYNTAVAALVRRWVDLRLADDPRATIAILEVGAGTGGTSAPVLEALADHAARVRYVFTDVSRRFLHEAEERFGRHPFVAFRPFDFEKDPVTQGFESGSFDIVIGTNCVHAVRSMVATLGRLKSLSKRGGLLVLNEFTDRLDYNTLTFGLTTGWWLFEDPEFRIKGSPLLRPESWRRVLEGLGYGGVRFLAPPPVGQGAVGQHLIVCESDGVVPEAEAPPSEAPSREAPLRNTGPAAAAPADRTAPPDAALYVKRVFAEVLKMAVAEVAENLTFDAFGVDSLLSMAILTRFEKDLGRLPATLLFECMTVAELAAYLLNNHSDRMAELVGHPPSVREASREAPPPPPVAVRVTGPETARPTAGRPVPAGAAGIAVIGLAGRFPGAGDIDQFWDNLAAGRNCVGEIPADRWDWRAAADGDDGGRWGGFITDIDAFDSLFFNISPREAAGMSPESRLFLETVWQAVEHAGYSPQRLKADAADAGGDVGVFVGCMYQQYPLQTDDAALRGVLASASYWSIANRVSYAFDFRGPSMAIDTACSSSLTAVHMACESIRRGECAVAVAGGVNLTLDPGKYANLRQHGMLATTSQSRSLGDGDGLIPAEGVAAVILKPLDRAIDDGDPILGVIRGGAINNGGRTGGFTVPNPNAQADMIATALERSGVHPETIGYVEVAANGSALGDPVEIAGLTRAFRRHTDRTGFCAVGAVKSNLGHPEAASGMAQLAKVLLQLRHRVLVPSLNAEPPNPKLDLAGTPFRVQRTLEPWPEPPAGASWNGGRPRRRAAISSFGAGGSNAHLIVEEHEAPAPEPPAPAARQIVVLSARTEDRLAERARALLAFLRKAGSTAPGLADIAYTLQVGREAMRARLAVVAGDTAELADTLARWCAVMDGAEVPAAAVDHLLVNTVGQGPSPMPLLLDGDEGQVYLAAVIAAGRLDKIARLWVMGIDIDWTLLHPDRRTDRSPRRRHLPGYPFARVRHWVDRAGASPVAVATPAAGPDRRPALPTPAPRPAAGVRPSSGPLGAPHRGALAALRENLRVFAAEVLDIAVAEIEPDIAMREYGFDSISLAQLAARASAFFGIDWPVDLFFSHPTIEQCVQYLWREYEAPLTRWHRAEAGDGAEEAAEEEDGGPVAVASLRNGGFPASGETPAGDDAIAIVGMSGYLPEADDPETFWEHLVAGRELISEIPERRLAAMAVSYRELCERTRSANIRGGFLNRVESFDSLFFGISPREAGLMDPQQRLLLETVWKTIENAGYAASDLAGRGIGVFVGVSNHDYSKLYQRVNGQPLAHTSTGMMVQSILANRVSYLFDFHGPSEIVDTACSSSTVALHRAVRAIRNGECEAAVVGGVNVLLDWHAFAVLREAGILSQDGRVRMLARDGTGYVRGEGVGAVLLKPLSRARADRDHIHALIRGTATNFDGKKYSLTAPSPLAQAEVMRRAIEQAGINPADVRHIEAQGSGSPLGDPVEINAFKGAFRDLYREWGQPVPDRPQCGIGYLKPQIGHLEAASGMAGLFKILLAMRHGVVPGTIDVEEDDTTVDLKGSPFFVTRKNRSWDRYGNGSGGCAGLHSFGLGGVNAHVVLQEYVS